MHNPALAHHWAEIFLKQLKALGVERVCIAPGSRSTILAIQAARIFGDATTVHFDERGLGFFALGASKISRKPTCLITTSGTAVANLLPAVIEAKQARVPLIVITADRPPELRERGSNQTIDQNRIFGSHVEWYFDIPCATEDIALNVVADWSLQAWERSLYDCGIGPVHVNWMFREPFFEGPESRISSASEQFIPMRSHPRRVVSSDMGELADLLRSSSRGVCVVGELSTPSEAQAVSEFVQRLGWVTIADPLSQLRMGRRIANLLNYGDLALLKEIPQQHQPDTILHIGGRIVSKRVSGFLSAKHGARVVHLSCNGDVVNPHAAVRERYVIDPETLRELAVAPVYADAGFVAFFRGRDLAVASVLESVPGCDDSWALTEPGILRALLQAVPHEQILMVGNSMPIRDFDMFARPRASAPFVVANRGASGIDGVVATGIGAALSSQRDGTIVVGDLSMLHDLNSLALLKGASQSITIVVINNDGGGIFSLLPVAKSEHFERNFATPHGLSFEQLAAGFSLRYARPTSHKDFLDQYGEAVTHRGATLLEISTSRDENAALHREIHSRIAEVLE